MFNVLAALAGLPQNTQPAAISPISIPQPQVVQTVQQNVTDSSKMGSWTTVNSYNDATMVSAPIDGTPVVCISPNENKAYFVTMNNGSKDISPFKLVPDIQNSSNSAPPTKGQNVAQQKEPTMSDIMTAINNLSGRLTQVEEFSQYMRQALEVTGNESTGNVQQSQTV